MRLVTTTTISYGEIIIGLLKEHTTFPLDLAAPDEGHLVKAGSPINADGEVTTGNGAIGILLYDVNFNRSPSGTLVKSGAVNATAAQNHCGFDWDGCITSFLPDMEFRGEISPSSLVGYAIVGESEVS